MAKVGIVLATYNEVENLPPLVERLEALEQDVRIYVVDDNSPDGTAATAQELAQRYGNISVLVRPGRLGLGSALRSGVVAVLEDGCDYVVTMDADLSHDPDDVPRLLEVVASGDADMAQGSRYVAGGGTIGWHWTRRLLSRVANLAYRHLLGTPPEVTTNFRAFNRRCAQVVATRCTSRGFEFQPEVTLMAMSQGLRIRQVPIFFTERVAGKSKLGLAQAIKGATFFAMAFILFRLRLGRFSRATSSNDK